MLNDMPSRSSVRREAFPAYRANISAYTVALIGSRTGVGFDFDPVWTQQKASTGIDDLVRRWSHIVDRELRATAGQRMPTEWAKKPDCWESLKSIDLPLPAPLPDELRNVGAAWTA